MINTAIFHKTILTLALTKRIFFSELCDFSNQMDDGVLIFAAAQEVQHLLRDHGHILRICDPEQQFKSLREKKEEEMNKCLMFWVQAWCVRYLSLNSEIRVVQTLNNGHLMLQGQFSIMLDDVRQGFQTWKTHQLSLV